MVGNVETKTAMYNEALDYYFKALAIKERINDKHGISQIYNNLGKVYFDAGHHDKALEYRLKALQIDRELGDKWEIANSTYNIAEQYLINGEPEKAYPYLLEAQELARDLDNKGLIRDNLHNFSLYYELRKDYQRALDYQKEYSESTKIIFSEELSEKVAELQTMYDTEKLEGVITEQTQELERQLVEQTVLRAVAEAGAEASTEDELITHITQIIGKNFFLDNFGILLLNNAGTELIPHSSYMGSHKPEENPPVPLGIGITGHVAADGEPRLISDVHESSEYLEVVSATRSEICVPLKIGSQVIGVVNAESIQLNAFTQDDLRLLNTLSFQLAIGIEKTRLFAQTQRSAQELQALASVTEALRTAENIKEMLPILIRETVEATQAAFGYIHLLEEFIIGDSTTPEKFLVARYCYPLRHDLIGLRHKIGEGLTGHVAATGEVYETDDILNDPLVQILPGEAEFLERTHSNISIPLKTQDDLIGVLNVGLYEQRLFTQEEKNILVSIADIAANAIRRATLHEQMEVQLQRMASLRRIDKVISGSLDLRIILKILVNQIVTQLKVDAATILLYDFELHTLEFAVGQGFLTTALQYTELNLGQGQAGVAALERRIIHISNSNKLDTNFLCSPQMKTENFVVYFGVPLVAKGKVVGVLEIFNRSLLNPNQEWMDFLIALAGQSAIAIENIHLFNGLKQSNLELGIAYETTLEGWAKALELKDIETEGHSRRVMELTIKIAHQMGINIGSEEMANIRRGALLHDIGKMGIPDNILQKPGKLSPEEWKIMKLHPVFAYEWLLPIHYLRQALAIPHYHHERWDGTGYPEGLKGEEIPLPARIFAIVDVWDALLSDRPYRKAWTKGKTLAHIREQSGKHFDPRVVEAFFVLIDPE